MITSRRQLRLTNLEFLAIIDTTEAQANFTASRVSQNLSNSVKERYALVLSRLLNAWRPISPRVYLPVSYGRTGLEGLNGIVKCCVWSAKSAKTALAIRLPCCRISSSKHDLAVRFFVYHQFQQVVAAQIDADNILKSVMCSGCRV